ncbi:hypothetical protein [Escherichia phage Mt1B1_P10]|uniref:Uncharacterized protein n=1 Tax=Escherichia phage Mt1B1_P10 TaxID=2743960 RepID=A0A7H0XC91_9CAUD|nr:hypothetical protein [Escherichia phage Mt1B1_P10]
MPLFRSNHLNVLVLDSLSHSNSNQNHNHLA